MKKKISCWGFEKSASRILLYYESAKSWGKKKKWPFNFADKQTSLSDQENFEEILALSVLKIKFEKNCRNSKL